MRTGSEVASLFTASLQRTCATTAAANLVWSEDASSDRSTLSTPRCSAGRGLPQSPLEARRGEGNSPSVSAAGDQAHKADNSPHLTAISMANHEPSAGGAVPLAAPPPTPAALTRALAELGLQPNAGPSVSPHRPSYQAIPRSPFPQTPRSISPVSSDGAISSAESSIFDRPSGSSRGTRGSGMSSVPKSSTSATLGALANATTSAGAPGPSGGGRKASVSLQLFKETARKGEEGAERPDALGRRSGSRPSPSKSRHPSGAIATQQSQSQSQKGKEREHTLSFPSPTGDSSSYVTFSSPLASPDAATFAPIGAIAREDQHRRASSSTSRSRNPSRPSSRLGSVTHSPSVTAHPFPASPARAGSFAYIATGGSAAAASLPSPQLPPHPLSQTHSRAPVSASASPRSIGSGHSLPALSHSSSFSHPFPVGISTSRPASPHLTTPQTRPEQHSSPRSGSRHGAGSPIPDLFAFDDRLGLGEPALPLPTPLAEDESDRADDEAIAEEAEDDDEDDIVGLEHEQTLQPSAPPSQDGSLPVSAALKLVYSPRSMHASDPMTPATTSASVRPPVVPSGNGDTSGVLDQRRRSFSSHARRLQSVDDAALEPTERGREGDLAASIASLPSPVPDSFGYPHAPAVRRAHFGSAQRPSISFEDAESSRSGTDHESWTGSATTSETDSRFSSSSDMSGDEYDSAEEEEDFRAYDGELAEEKRMVDDEEYEVDMGALREKLERGGGGEVSMRRDARRAGDFKGQLVGGDGQTSATVPLEPFRHQVGGHSHIFRFSKKAVCKVSNACDRHSCRSLS